MRGKWWVALLALIAFPVAMAALTLVMDKRYTASMRLLATQRLKPYDTNSGPLAPIDDISNSTVLGSIETTVQVLTGTEVLGQAIVATAQKYPEAFQGDALSAKYESLIRRLSVDSSPQSDVITVRVTMDDPEIASDVANNVGFAFIEYVRRMENENGNATLATLNKMLGESSSKLDNIDNQIKAIKNEYQIADATASNQYASSTIFQAETKNSENEGLLQATKAALVVAQANLRNIPPTIETNASNQVNPTLLELNTSKVRLENTLAALRIKYLDDADPVKETQLQLAAVNKSIATIKQNMDMGTSKGPNPNYLEAQRNVASLKTSVASAEQQVAASRAILATMKGRVGNLPEAERKLNQLLRQRLVLENTFVQLQQKKDVIESTGSGRKSPARIVSTALPPTAPSFPDVRLFTLIGLAIGFIVAALIIMPRGDTDLYGQWPKSDSKELKGRSREAVATQADAPALSDKSPGDTTQS